MGDSESAVPLPRLPRLPRLVCTVQAALLPVPTWVNNNTVSRAQLRPVQVLQPWSEPISCAHFRNPSHKYTYHQKSVADFLSCLTEPSNTMARGANVVIVG
jgi:hypothetical protein